MQTNTIDALKNHSIFFIQYICANLKTKTGLVYDFLKANVFKGENM